MTAKSSQRKPAAQPSAQTAPKTAQGASGSQNLFDNVQTPAEVQIVVHNANSEEIAAQPTSPVVAASDSAVVPIPETNLKIYQGATMLTLTEEEAKRIGAPVDISAISVRAHDGVPYVPQVYTRIRLNHAFGFGRWSLIEIDLKEERVDRTDKVKINIYFVGALYAKGCFIAKAIGESEYHLNNANESYATAYESAKSDCLTRCVKDLGIFSELWQPNFIQKYSREHIVKVFVNGKTKPQYRRVSDPQFFNETGLCDDSPVKPEGYQPNFKRDNPSGLNPNRPTPFQTTPTGEQNVAGMTAPNTYEPQQRQPSQKLNIEDVKDAVASAETYMKGKNAKIETIKAKYNMTEATEKKLINIQLDAIAQRESGSSNN